MILPLPDAPANGDGLSVIAWALVAVLAVIVGGAGVLVAKLTPLIQTMLCHILETKALATSVADSVNHRHPGAPTLADHAVMTRATVERLEENLVDFDRRNEAIHREIIGDVSSLKAWARRWGDLPPEPSSDGSGGRNRLDVRLGQLEAQEAEKETTDDVEP